ncbi:hypothetical protein [Sporosarcina sp. BP05]|nr:hypothetical protein [Sporosarcina sp. BP05]
MKLESLEKSYLPYFTDFVYESYVYAYALEFHIAADTNGYQITVDKN